jgi:hypothetical protein
MDSSWIFAFIMAAVSPAVIIPAMQRLKFEGYDEDVVNTATIGASVDDVFTLSVLTIIFSLAFGTSNSV